ncbi:MAG: DUF1289 domain-containing protein [Xanthobacteraceae bacterium]
MSVESPCIDVCTVHPSRDLCLGCGRSLSEIASWLSLSSDERSRIMAELPQRLALLTLTPRVSPLSSQSPTRPRKKG